MTPIDEKLLASMQENITNGLKEGTIKMGNIIPLMHYAGTSNKDKGFAPTFYQFLITPNYMKELHNHYEKLVAS